MQSIRQLNEDLAPIISENADVVVGLGFEGPPSSTQGRGSLLLKSGRRVEILILGNYSTVDGSTVSTSQLATALGEIIAGERERMPEGGYPRIGPSEFRDAFPQTPAVPQSTAAIREVLGLLPKAPQ